MGIKQSISTFIYSDTKKRQYHFFLKDGHRRKTRLCIFIKYDVFIIGEKKTSNRDDRTLVVKFMLGKHISLFCKPFERSPTLRNLCCKGSSAFHTSASLLQKNKNIWIREQTVTLRVWGKRWTRDAEPGPAQLLSYLIKYVSGV